MSHSSFFANFLQLKSSLQLHIDGSSPIAEDVGRQVFLLLIFFLAGYPAGYTTP